MKFGAIYKGFLLIYFLANACGALSVSFSSGGSEGESSISANYDLDSSTSLDQSVIMGDGDISSVQSAKGSGTNSIAQTASNQKASVSSSITSTDNLASIASSYASGDIASIGQTIQATGQSESTISASSASLTADQKAGVLGGAIASSQMATAGDGSVSALQASSISGALGYADGEASSSDNTVKVTGGLNGIGDISGFIATIASNRAEASGSLQADSFESKAYSAAQSTSKDGNAYSYLSSDNQLASTLSASADSHVTSNQDLRAKGDVLVHASSTSEDLIPKRYDANGESVSGRLSASAGSPAVVETDLDGDVQSSMDSLIPMPGAWVWNGLGGIITSNPSTLKDDQGQMHVFAKGADNSLYDNKNGNWFGLGGGITSDPYAVKDAQGKIHVLARGKDYSLWDHVLGVGWQGLGGYITSNPSAALKPSDSHLKAVVKGGDNSLWVKDLTTGTWTGLGGQITSNPQAIFDDKGKMHVLARGSDGSLLDNVDGAWQPRGGYITSDARPVLNPSTPGFVYTMVRGSDGSLWSNAFNTNSNTATWQGLGGFFNGNPAPAVDANGVTHTFVRGGDSGLWDNANGGWHNLDRIITSDPSATKDKNGRLFVAARCGDNSLWATTRYDTIQQAVDAANVGSFIKVLSGTYKEKVKIAKSLTLKGDGADQTIVDGNRAGQVFNIGQGTGVTISNLAIQNGKADWGAGIWNSGTLTLNGVKIAGNEVTYGGGGIYNNQGTLNLNGVSISGNLAKANGGGIFNYGTLNLNGGSIDHNTAVHGGGILNEYGNANLKGNFLISDNKATGSGGGIYNNYGTTTMNSGSIARNLADYDGGGICNFGTFNLNSGSIDHNIATFGGGIANEQQQGKTIMKGGSVSFNKATGSGGGVYNWYGAMDLIGGSISSNNADYDGGGICQDHSTMNLNGGSIDNNKALRCGGGITNLAGATLNLNGATVSFNTAVSGGGIYNENVMTMNSGSISQNTANSGGGGIFNNGAITLNRGSIDHNKAAAGGGIYRNQGTVNGITSIVHDNTPNQIVP